MDYDFEKAWYEVDKAVSLMHSFRARSHLETLQNLCAEWIANKFNKDFKEHGEDWIESQYRIGAWEYEPETDILDIYTNTVIDSNEFKDVFYKFFMKICWEELSSDIPPLDKKILITRYYDPLWRANDGSDVIDIIKKTVWDYISVED